MRQLTDTQARILAALARYRFLTADQILSLAIIGNRAHLYRILADLCDAPALVGKYATRPIHGKGTFPSLHYLTDRGAEALAELTQDDIAAFKYPKGRVSFSSLLVHTTRCVWAEIAVRQWAEKSGHAVDFFYNDFDTQGDNRTGKNGKLRKMTRIDLDNGEHLIPDAVFQLTDAEGTPRLFVLEIHNEMRTKRIADKLSEYREAITQGAIRRQFKYDAAPRILAIFESQNHASHALAAMEKGGRFRQWERYFYLKSLDDMRIDFRYGWQTLNGMSAIF